MMSYEVFLDLLNLFHFFSFPSLTKRSCAGPDIMWDTLFKIFASLQSCNVEYVKSAATEKLSFLARGIAERNN